MSSPKPISKSLSLRSALPANAISLSEQCKEIIPPAAEPTLRTLEGSLRIFEKHRQAIFDRQEAKQQSPTPPKLNHNLQPEGLRALE
jgi:hypothetical protein